MSPDEYRMAIDAACMKARPLTLTSALETALGVLQPDTNLQNQFQTWFSKNGQKYVDNLNAAH